MQVKCLNMGSNRRVDPYPPSQFLQMPISSCESLPSSILKTKHKHHLSVPLSALAQTSILMLLSKVEPLPRPTQLSYPSSPSRATSAISWRETVPSSTRGVTQRLQCHPEPCQNQQHISAGDHRGAMPEKLLCVRKILNDIKRPPTLK